MLANFRTEGLGRGYPGPPVALRLKIWLTDPLTGRKKTAHRPRRWRVWIPEKGVPSTRKDREPGGGTGVSLEENVSCNGHFS